MMSRAGMLALLVLGCVISGVVCTTEDGLPRPPNFPIAPTVSYGSTPALTDSSGPVACEWYGWANSLYDATTGAQCLDVLRLALTNATVNPPQKLSPYTYYTIKRLVNPANNQSYCYEGCYNLADLALSPSPLGEPLAPSPLSDAPPPTLLTPAASPPALEPSASSPTPVGDSSPVMEPVPSPSAGSVLSPPAPLGVTTVNHNGGSSVAPSAFLSFLVAAFALRILNLAVL